MSFERMLDKSVTPTLEDMRRYVGERGKLWKDFGLRISEMCLVQTAVRFPYGNSYGWSVRYGAKGKQNKHICDVFAESGAFTAHFRVRNAQLDKVYDSLSDYSKSVCDGKYPCGDGGWLSYRVLTESDLEDVLKILKNKIG